MSVLARAREWFLLRDVETRAATLAPGVRARSTTLFRLSDQRRRAAEALWIAGFPAEALRLADDALALAHDAVGEKIVPAAEVRSLDEEVTAADGVRFRAVLVEHDRIQRTHEELVLDSREVVRRRISRVALAVASALIVISAVYFFARTPRVLKATASAVYDARYDAPNAVDGNDGSDWLLPDRTAGWIEIAVIPARKVSRVKLLNARNVPYNDRATHEFRVQSFSNGSEVKSVAGQFETYSAEPSWRTVDVGGAKIDRIRIEVKSWHLSGGGLSEVEVD